MTDPRTFPTGVPCWIDLEPADLDAAAEFYGALLGWTFHTATPPDAPQRYLVAQVDGQDAVGLGDALGQPAVWNTYVAVPDCDAHTATLRDAGGTVVQEPVDAGPGGRWSAVTDPQGATVRLWQARRRLGAQVANVPNAWNFSDLHTTDPDAARAFYGPAFGWRFADSGFPAIQVPGYGDHLAATVDPDIHERQEHAPAGFADVVGGIAAVADGEAPHWHVTFTVADRDAVARDAERLGGSVVATTEDGWTRRAVVRDPQGAEFTASQFTPPEEWS